MNEYMYILMSVIGVACPVLAARIAVRCCRVADERFARRSPPAWCQLRLNV